MVKYVEESYEASADKTQDRDYAAKINWWRKIPEGAHFIRVLPPVETMQDGEGRAPFYWLAPIHFGIHPGNKRIVYCPRRASKGELSCAICEIWLPYVRKDSTATAQERKVAKDHLPKWVNYMNILLMDTKTGEPVREKDGGILVRVWGAGNDIIDKILRRMEEYKEEHGEFPNLTHPVKGLSIRIFREGSGETDTEYDATLKKAFDITPYAEWWEEQLVDLPVINPPTTTEQVAALVAGKGTPDAFEALPEGAPAPEPKGNPFEDDENTVEAEFKDVTDAPSNPFEDDEPAPKNTTKGDVTSTKGSAKLAALLEND